MTDQKIIGLMGANVGLSGVNSFVNGLMPVLNVVLILSQIAIAVATAYMLWKKLKKNDSDPEA